MITFIDSNNYNLLGMFCQVSIPLRRYQLAQILRQQLRASLEKLLQRQTTNNK